MLMRRNEWGNKYGFSRIWHMFDGRVEGRGNDAARTEVLEYRRWCARFTIDDTFVTQP
jgi:hypothetical protein